MFSKWPVYDQWNPAIPYNINASAILVTFVSLNTVFDLATLGIPLASIRSLRIDTHRKLVLSTIFSLGSM